MKIYIKNSTVWDSGWSKRSDNGNPYYVCSTPKATAHVELFDDDGNWGWRARIWNRRENIAAQRFYGEGSKEEAMDFAEQFLF